MRSVLPTVPRFGVRLVAAALAVASLLPASRASATDPTDPEAEVHRLLTLLAAVGEEYREGVRDGVVVRPIELEEAKIFLQDAQQRFAALAPGLHAAQADLSLFAEVAAAIEQKAPSDTVDAQLAALRQRVISATGVSEQVYPPSVPSAARGKALFAEYCVTCHGKRGNGKGPSAAALHPPPANFTDPQFMRPETPYDFYHVISLGKSHTAMPAWDGVLSVQERWDLVSYVWTLAPGEAGIAEGQGVYLAQCASCHGATGNGQGVFSEALVAGVPDLSTPQALARKADGALFAAATGGVAGTAMPSFARTLGDDERWKAVAFMRLLSHGGPGGLTATGASGAGSESKRFGGLLRLLGSAYERGWTDGRLTNAVEYDKATVVARQVGDAAALMAARAPDANAAAALHAAAAAVATQVAERAAVAAVTASIAQLAALVESQAPTAPAAAVPSAIEAALTESARLLDLAVAGYGRGSREAPALASDAYLQFEPLEVRLGATAPALKTGIEERFLQLRQLLRAAGNDAEVRSLARAIHDDYGAVRTALVPQTGRYALFAQSATIILREGFEVVLVIGALLAYVVKAGSPAMQRPIYAGTAAGIAASVVTAFVMGELLRLHPNSAEVLEGATMLLAAAVLFFVSYWLVSKSEAEKWQRFIQGKVKAALSSGSAVALAGAAFLAVYREGVETVLFYHALFSSASGEIGAPLGGVIAGGLALAAVCVVFHQFGMRMPIRQFFLGTSVLLYCMAFVFAGRGLAELQEAGWITFTPVTAVPRIDFLGVYPTLETLLAQGVLVALLVFAVGATVWRRRQAVRENVLIAEIRSLHALALDLRNALAHQPRTASAADGSTAARVEALVDRVAYLESELQEPSGRNGTSTATGEKPPEPLAAQRTHPTPADGAE